MHQKNSNNTAKSIFCVTFDYYGYLLLLLSAIIVIFFQPICHQIVCKHCRCNEGHRCSGASVIELSWESQRTNRFIFILIQHHLKCWYLSAWVVYSVTSPSVWNSLTHSCQFVDWWWSWSSCVIVFALLHHFHPHIMIAVRSIACIYKLVFMSLFMQCFMHCVYVCVCDVSESR